MTKITKDAADYGRGMKSAHCGICRHYKPPDACDRVVGKVSAAGGCRLFSRQQGKGDAP